MANRLVRQRTDMRTTWVVPSLAQYVHTVQQQQSHANIAHRRVSLATQLFHLLLLSHIPYCCAGGRQSWDIGRFAKTVAYFNEPPNPQQIIEAIFKPITNMLSGGPATAAQQMQVQSAAAAAAAGSNLSHVYCVRDSQQQHSSCRCSQRQQQQSLVDFITDMLSGGSAQQHSSFKQCRQQ